MNNTIKLQGISGRQAGTKAEDLKIGDVIIWNFGYKSEVVEITPSKTGKTITFMLKSFESGNVSARKMGAERLAVSYTHLDVYKRQTLYAFQITLPV